MRTLAHISDLHFGAESPRLADALRADLDSINPALVVVSGDLTQRARCRQFQAAQSWLERLPFPKLVVPGNHDIPLFDLARRLLSPLGRYRRFISEELNPFYEDDEIAVLGLNTARSLSWKSGRISRRQIALLEHSLRLVPAHKFNVVVTHHPFIPPPGEQTAGIDLVGCAAAALAVIDASCVDLLLAGHLHSGYTGDVRSYYPATRRSIVVAQAGTAISHRLRGRANGYNVIHLEKELMRIVVRCWKGQQYQSEPPLDYKLIKEEWRLQRGGRG